MAFPIELCFSCDGKSLLTIKTRSYLTNFSQLLDNITWNFLEFLFDRQTALASAGTENTPSGHSLIKADSLYVN